MTMAIEDMFGDLRKIDILAESKAEEVLMVLVCNGFVDGSPKKLCWIKWRVT